jgi:sugar lactone lactonase YvrE
MQAVPTAIVEGPDGAYYMGQLTGFPFPIGGASVYRIDPRTGAASVFATGFTNIMDLAFDKRGTLYVLEIDSNGIILDPPSGAVHSITRRGSRDVVVPPDGTLTAPGGITIGRGGELYVTNNARSPDSGEVLRIER